MMLPRHVSGLRYLSSSLRNISSLSQRIFYSPIPDIDIPTNLNLYDFVFHETPNTSSTHPWFIPQNKSSPPYTRATCLTRTDGLASVMKRHWDVKRGDVIAVFSPNDVDFMNVCWAAHKIGAVVNTLNASFTSTELAGSLKLLTKNYNLRLIFTTPQLLPTLQGALSSLGRTDIQLAFLSSSTPSTTPTVDEALALPSSREACLSEPIHGKDDLAFLCLSSGTTGHPKLIKINHDSVVANVLQMTKWREGLFDPRRDRALGVLPFSHIYGLVKVAHFHVYNSIPLVILPKFDLSTMLQAIQDHRISLLYIVPPMALLLTKSTLTSNYDLSHVHFAMSGAAPLPAAVTEAFQHKFPNILLSQGYGMTEVPTGVSISPVGHGVPFPNSSGGQLLPNTRARIVDPLSGESLGPGERGELRIESPSKASGYVCEEGESDEMLDGEGWVRTGDLCYFDEMGNLFVEDRMKELIKSRGYSVAPAELEGLILGHPEVIDAAVIGVPNEFSGEAPRAYVVSSAEDPQSQKQVRESIMRMVRKSMSSYKALEDVRFVQSIPKNPSGKILRKVVREWAQKERDITSLPSHNEGSKNGEKYIHN